MTRDFARARIEGTWRRRGFAFTEVLFAVMVLGIGFIMIAAMFPVTIQQTKLTLDESVGASMARGALAYLQTQATEANFPVSAPTIVPGTYGPVQVVSMPQAFTASALIKPGWVATRGNYINPSDPRTAWVPLYLRGFTASGDPSPYAQVFIIAVKARNKPSYVASDVYPGADTPTPWAVLEPRRVAVNLTYDALSLRGRMTILAGGNAYAAPGAYVIIANDQNSNPPRNITGQSTGRIYRLGNVVDETNGVWDLAPDGDMIRANRLTGGAIVTGDDNDLANTDAYIIGHGYKDGDPAQPYSGPAQDMAVYTGFIRINPPLPPP
jgi:hypothetical protein